LARLVARALAEPGFRAELKAALDGSPYAEHKLHFQRLLAAEGGRVAAAIARANGLGQAEVAREAAALGVLEIYLPVPEHRAAWTGDEQVLVATAEQDGDAPVAFDVAGRRSVLSPEQPPRTPVIAVVPAETDFQRPPQPLVYCLLECDGGGGGGYVPPSPTPGLYMTKAHFVDDFEGWLKGNPEFEVHMLGQKGQSDSLVDYQCAGEHAGGPYAFDQNGRDWSGSVLLFSGTQLANYNAAHPGQNLRVFFVEDDDTACVIKSQRSYIEDVFKTVDAAYNAITAGNDSSDVWRKRFSKARALQALWVALAGLIKTNDELVGNAVEDAVVPQLYPGFNWFVKGKNNVTNGWVRLEMK
ncbi:MAG: hypothetical protein ACREMJ_03120, partial [Gemmatimonadales bacterium]